MTVDLDTELRTTLRGRAELVPDDTGERLCARLDVRRAPTPHAGRRLAAVVAAVAAVVVVSFAVPAVVGHPPGPVDVSERVTARPVEGIEGVSLRGARVRAADYRGAPLLVVAWGSWCLPCRTQLGEMEDALRPTGVQVLGLADRDSRANARALVDELGVRFESIVDPRGRIAARLPGGAGGYPTTWLVDADGRVVERWPGVVHDWRPVIDALASLATFSVEPAQVRPGEQVLLDYPAQASHPLDHRLVPATPPGTRLPGWYEVRAGPDDGRVRWVERSTAPRGSPGPTVLVTGDSSFAVPTEATAGQWWICAGRGDCRSIVVTDP